MADIDAAIVEAVERTQSLADLTEESRDAIAATLTTTYWRLREHASAYRGTKAFRTTFERWQANRDDPRAYQKHVIHEFYARGIEAAAREVAKLAGVTEQEIVDNAPNPPSMDQIRRARQLVDETYYGGPGQPQNPRGGDA